MTTVQTDAIKKLRAMTGAKMMECKKALEESGGDLAKAQDLLRIRGVTSAVKKGGRETTSGVAGVFRRDNRLVLLEMCSETDFVAMNSRFQGLVEMVGNVALGLDEVSVESVLKSSVPGGGTVEESIGLLISVMGENLVLKHIEVIDCVVPSMVLGFYVHHKYTENLGKIASVVRLKGVEEGSSARELADHLAMHASAMKPLCLDRESVDVEVRERELSVLRERFESTGKPEEILQKMIAGAMDKFFQEIVFLEQSYILEQGSSVQEILKKYGKDFGSDLSIAFYRVCSISG